MALERVVLMALSIHNEVEYSPASVHASDAQADALDGPEVCSWYFHLYLWSILRQKHLTRFLCMLWIRDGKNDNLYGLQRSCMENQL